MGKSKSAEAVNQAENHRLWTSSFVVVNIILLLNFSNMSVFFQLNNYLKSHGMDQSDIGLVIGLFSLAALVVRPLLSPILQPANSRPWIIAGVLGTVICLLLYAPAKGFWQMSLLRLAHGIFYTLIAAAAMTMLTACIPPTKSAQAFGVTGVVALLPFALVPALLPALEKWLGGFTEVLTAGSLLVAGILLLLPLVKVGRDGTGKAFAFNLHDVLVNLRQPVIMSLMGGCLLMYAAFACLFYFVQDFAKGHAIAVPGLFFTLATAAEIFMRMAFGPFWDKVSKKRSIVVSLAVGSSAYLLLPAVGWQVNLFYILAVVFGLAWGVLSPAMNAMIFDLSEPRFRAMNTNLGFEMMQGGYFVGPLLGAHLLESTSYGLLFTACAGASLLAAGLVIMFVRDERRS